MIYLRLLALTFCLALICSAAHADTLTTFNISGSQKSGNGSLSGTITIDVTKGYVVSDLFSLNGKSDSGVKNAKQTSSFYSFNTLQGDVLKIMVGSLVNFTGGAFTLSNGCTGYIGGITSPSSPAPTPEPSSIALLGTGLLGVAGAVRRRRTQTA